ncbi:DUF2142 domain-containing protein [Curtanaerobium respiraculi]|uniref:DUF2142 domain-containing protein n=1 Tax=Curtanaerobium respiraculi TaxID=2949669 RepID=UPI0024B3C59C|nr:DUF2142 domain-containing protein [Curtanaerobium respiraculi]
MNPLIGKRHWVNTLTRKVSSLGAKVGKTDALAAVLLLASFSQTLYFYSEAHALRVAGLGLLSCMVVVGFWAWHHRSSNRPEWVSTRLFPIALLMGALSFALFFPPGSIPDEPYHFKNAYRYANIIGLQDIHTMRSADYDFMHDGLELSAGVTAEHWDAVSGGFSLLASDRTTFIDTEFARSSISVSADDEVVYMGLSPVQLEIPAALGILIAKVFGLGAVPLFYLGRLGNLLFGVFLIIAAVRITPVGKNVFIVLALLPMTLHLLGSYSYDVGIIGMSFLLTALLLQAIFGTGKISKASCAGIIVVAALLAPCKVVYVVLGIAILFVPSQRFSSHRSAILFKAGVLIVPLIFIGAVRLSALVEYATGSSPEAVRADGTSGSYYTLSGLLLHPLSSFKLLDSTLEVHGWGYLVQIVGGMLGWFQGDIALPTQLSVALLMLLVLSVVRSLDSDEVLPLRMRIVFGLVFAAGALAIFLSLTIGWTYDTSGVIEGVQGRYFIPLLPLGLLALRPRCVKITANTGFPLILTLASFNFLYLSYISTCVLLA